MDTDRLTDDVDKGFESGCVSHATTNTDTSNSDDQAEAAHLPAKTSSKLEKEGGMVTSRHNLLRRFDRRGSLSLNTDLTNFGFCGYDVAAERTCNNRDRHEDREEDQLRQGNLEPLYREEIFDSKLVSSIRDATANLTKIQDYEIEEMKNQDPRDVF
jgi:hypothetical protein